MEETQNLKVQSMGNCFCDNYICRFLSISDHYLLRKFLWYFKVALQPTLWFIHTEKKRRHMNSKGIQFAVCIEQ